MLRYEILRYQWLLAALGGGLVLLLSTVMSYTAIWRKRSGQAPELPECPPGDTASEEASGEPCRRALTFLQALPAVLIMTYAAIAIFMAAYFVDKIISPPNW